MVWERSSWFPWAFPKRVECWVHHKQRDNPWSGNVHLHMHQRKPMTFYLQGRQWSQFWGMQNALFFWLSTKGSSHQWTVLSELVEAVTKGYRDKTPSKTDKSYFVSSGIWSSTQSLGFNDDYVWLLLWTRYSLPNYPDLTVSVPQHEKSPWSGTASSRMIISAVNDFFFYQHGDHSAWSSLISVGREILDIIFIHGSRTCSVVFNEEFMLALEYLSIASIPRTWDINSAILDSHYRQNKKVTSCLIYICKETWKRISLSVL